MYCTNCGHKVEDDHNFCTNCGARVARIQPSIAKSGGSPANLTASEKALLAQIAKINKQDKEMPAELYQKMRDFEVAWLERNYDFNSVNGIASIPVVSNPKGAPSNNITGEVYYYLRHKAYKHEESGHFDLALACMKKSVALVMLRSCFSEDDCYPLVKMLARFGYVKEAYAQKNVIDQYIADRYAQLQASFTSKSKGVSSPRDTDLVIMDVHGSTCPLCAIYQGRVYSVSGKSKKFPKVPDFYFSSGAIHEGCGHCFWPYYDGITDPMLDDTLSVHPLQNKAFGRDIVTFSNRPFVDDRTDACKQAANKVIEEQAAAIAKQQKARDQMIEVEAKRGQEQRDYIWLQSSFPDKCPKSITSYRRMKTQNTKNYQQLQQLAAEKGRKI